MTPSSPSLMSCGSSDTCVSATGVCRGSAVSRYRSKALQHPRILMPTLPGAHIGTDDDLQMCNIWMQMQIRPGRTEAPPLLAQFMPGVLLIRRFILAAVVTSETRQSCRQADAK